MEQKDAAAQQRAIQEQNAGFYCFNYDFLRTSAKKLGFSAVTGEVYITDLIEMAQKEGLLVAAHQVPFEQVGTGINTPQQLTQSALMMAG